mmetsp:Transcript_3683/g.8905  ORF Transcript_3683/g.8905 Transcript_3683/m.8905 type:complete len:85 (+) Transcript_3683:135-389(+)
MSQDDHGRTVLTKQPQQRPKQMSCFCRFYAGLAVGLFSLVRGPDKCQHRVVAKDGTLMKYPAGFHNTKGAISEPVHEYHYFAML